MLPITEHQLMAEIQSLRDTNLEYIGMVGAQSAQIQYLIARLNKAKEKITNLEEDKTKAETETELEARKAKTKAQFEVFDERVNRAETVRDGIANAAAPLLNAIFQNGLSSSSDDIVEIFDKLRSALDKYFKNIFEAATVGASQALAMIKSLYPRVDISVIGDGYINGTTNEQAMELINEAQESARKIAEDVIDHF